MTLFLRNKLIEPIALTDILDILPVSYTHLTLPTT